MLTHVESAGRTGGCWANGVIVNAIETRYGGTLFRSRLEAKWAAFFDLLGWRWEYEPFDLAGYIPDFLLPDFKTRLIVEVKPEITDEAKEKIERSGWDGEALLVGSGPAPRGHDDGWRLGDLAERTGPGSTGLPSWWWSEGVLGCAKSSHPYRGWDGKPVQRECLSVCDQGFGLVHAEGGFNCRRCGDYDGNCCASEADVAPLWREAGNRTRWTPVAR